MKSKKGRFFNRVTCAFLLVIFTSHTVLFDPIALGSLSVSGNQEVQISSQKSFPFSIPSELASIEEYSEGLATEGAQPFVLHIQDIHANPEAQKKVYNLLKTLGEQHKDKHPLLVGLEGAKGALFPRYFRFFNSLPKVNNSIVEDLFEKGEVAGAELLAWEALQNSGTDLPLSFYGVEEVPLYRENLKTYQDLFAQKQKIEQELRRLETLLQSLQSKMLSEALRDFLKERQRRKEGKYEGHEAAPQLLAYIPYLAKQSKEVLQIDLEETIEQIRFPQMARFLTIAQIEKQINQEEAAKEKKEVFKQLRKKVRSEQEKALLDQLENFQPAIPNLRELLEDFWMLASRNQVNLLTFPEFLKKMGLLVLNSELEAEALFGEMEQLEFWVIERLAVTSEEKRFVTILDHFSLLGNMLKLELTRKSWEKVNAIPLGVRPVWLLEQLKDVLGTQKVASKGAWHLLEPFYAQAMKFYKVAEARDKALLGTLLEKAKGPYAVLISGGFHSQGLTDLMKKQGVGYAVLRPTIKELKDLHLAEKVFLDQNANVASYLENISLTKQEKLFFKGIMESGASALSEQGMPLNKIAEAVSQAVNEHEVLSRKLQFEVTQADLPLSMKFKIDFQSPASVSPVPSAVSSQGVAMAYLLQHLNTYAETKPPSTQAQWSDPAQIVVGVQVRGDVPVVVSRIMVRKTSPSRSSSRLAPGTQNVTSKSEGRTTTVGSPILADNTDVSDLIGSLGFEPVTDPQQQASLSARFLRRPQALIGLDSSFITGMPDFLFDYNRNVLPQLGASHGHQSSVALNLLLGYVGLERGRRPVRDDVSRFFREEVLTLQGMFRGRRSEDPALLLRYPYVAPEMEKVANGWRNVEGDARKEAVYLEKRIDQLSQMFPNTGDARKVNALLKSILPGARRFFHYTSHYGDIIDPDNAPKDHHELASLVRGIQAAQEDRSSKRLTDPVVVFTRFETGRKYTDNNGTVLNIHDQNLAYLRGMNDGTREIDFYDFQDPSAPRFPAQSNGSDIIVINLPPLPSQLFNELYVSSHFAVVAGDMGLRYLVYLALLGTGPLTLLFPHLNGQGDLYEQFAETLKSSKIAGVSVAETQVGKDVLAFLKNFFDIQNPQMHLESQAYEAFSKQFSQLLLDPKLAAEYRNVMAHFMDGKFNMYGFFLKILEHVSKNPHFVRNGLRGQNPKTATEAFGDAIVSLQPTADLSIPSVDLGNLVPVLVVREFLTGKGDAVFLMQQLAALKKGGFDPSKKAFVLLADTVEEDLIKGLVNYEVVSQGTPFALSNLIFVRITRDSDSNPQITFFRLPEGRSIREAVRSSESRSESRQRRRQVVQVGDDYVELHQTGPFSMVATRAFKDEENGGFRRADKDVAMNDLLGFNPETQRYENVDPTKENVVFVAAHNESPEDRGAKVAASIEGVEVIAAEKNQDAVYQGAEADIKRISDLTGFEKGEHGQSATKKLLRKYRDGEDGFLLPKVLALGLNDVLIDFVEQDGETHRGHVDDESLELIVSLMAKGVQIAFITDEMADPVKDGVGSLLFHAIKRRMTSDRAFSKKQEVTFYTSHGVEKFTLVVESFSQKRIKYEDDPEYRGTEFSLSSELEAIVTRSSGFAQEVTQEEFEQSGGETLHRGDMVLEGPLGSYYHRTTEVAPVGKGRRHRGLTEETTKKYGSFNREMTSSGNIEGVAPERIPVSNGRSIFRISPIASREAPGASVDENEKDERDIVFDDIVNQLEREHQKLEENKEEAEPLDWTPLSSVADLVSARDERYEELMELERALVTRFNEISEKYLAQAALDDETQEPTDDLEKINAKLEKYFQGMAQIAREAYDIAVAALKESQAEDEKSKTDDESPSSTDSWNLVKALKFFGMARRYRVLTREAYLNAVRGTPFAPSEREMPDFVVEQDEHIASLDHDWRNAINSYQSKYEPWQLAVENILYDLRVSDQDVLTGASESGRAFDSLYEIANGLLTFVLMHGEGAPEFVEKAQAAMFLQRIFQEQVYNGVANNSLDDIAGATVPLETYAKSRGKSLKDLEDTLLYPFATFSNPFSEEEHVIASGENKHSRTAPHWIAEAAGAIANYYMDRNRQDALEVAAQEHIPEVAQQREIFLDPKYHKKERGRVVYTYEGMKRAFEDNKDKTFEHNGESRRVFRKAVYTKGGKVIQVPARGELMADSVRDPTDILTLEGDQMSIFQASVELTLEDGTIGRNINIAVEVKDQEEMEADEEGNKPVIRVHSADMVWTLDFHDARDVMKKTDATLVLDTLVSLAIIPRELLLAAIQDGKEVEALKLVMDHLFGPGKSLEIFMHVDNIQGGSGLSVSNLLAVGMSLLIDSTTGTEPAEVGYEDVLEVSIPIAEKDQKRTDSGWYEIEVSDSPNFEDAYRFRTKLPEGSDELKGWIRGNSLEPGKPYYVRTHYVESADFRKRTVSDDDWVYYQNGFVVSKDDDAGTFEVSPQDAPCDTNCSAIGLKPIKHKWGYHDSLAHIQRAAAASQMTGFYLDMKGGIQDDSAAKGGKMRLVVSEGPIEGFVSTDEYGNPLPIGKRRKVRLRSGITPHYYDVVLPPAAEEAFNRQVFVSRIGLSHKADDSLSQWTGTHYLNANEEGNMVWRKLSDLAVASVVTLHDPKSSIEFGKIGQAGIPLRHKLGDVSITPYVVEALSEWAKENSDIADQIEIAFNFIQTGARISGSVFLKFPPNISLEQERRVKADVNRRLKEKIESMGKLAPVDEAPVIYSVRIVRDGRGARIRDLDEEEFKDWKARHWAAVQVAKKAQQARSRAERPLHSRSDLKTYREKFHFNDRDETLETGKVTPDSEQERVLTTEPGVREDIQALRKKKRFQGDDDLITYGEKQGLAEKRFEKENQPFKTSVSIDAFRNISERLEKNTNKLREVLDKTSPEAVRALFKAIRQGHVDFLVDYSIEDLVKLANLLLPPQDLQDGLEIVEILDKYKSEREDIYSTLEAMKEEYEKKKSTNTLDVVRFQDNAFWTELRQNIRDLEEDIAGYTELEPEHPEYDARAAQEHQERIEMLKALKAAPSPEYLPDDHPLFYNDHTSAYRRIKRKRDLLQRVVLAGGLVLYVRQGGAGSRMGGGDTVKSALPWWHAGESDAFSGQKTGMIWGFYKRYTPVNEDGVPIDPDDTQEIDRFFAQIGLHGYLNSAITEDANERVREKATADTGLSAGAVSVQSMRRVYHLTVSDFGNDDEESELKDLLDEELPKVKDKKARDALVRAYGEYGEYAREQLAIAKKHKLVAEDAIRAPYVDGGILDDDDDVLRQELLDLGEIAEDTPDDDVIQKIKDYRLQGKGLNPMANYAPSGTAGEIEGWLVGAKPQAPRDESDKGRETSELESQRWSRQELLDLGFELNDLANHVPEEELENGMPLAKAALIVKKKKGMHPLSVVYAKNNSSMEDFNPAAIAEAAERIVEKGDFMVAELVNMVGAGEKGGVFTMKWFLGVRSVEDLKKAISYPDNGQLNHYVDLVKTKKEKENPKRNPVSTNEGILRHLVLKGLLSEDDANYVRHRFLKRQYEQFKPEEFMAALINTAIPTTHEGRRAKYMEKGFLRHVAMASGNAAFSTRQLWKISGYFEEGVSEEEAKKAFLASRYTDRREKFDHVMNHQMTNTYSVKWRKETRAGGDVKQWPVIQRETVTMSSIEFLVKLGLGVSFLERGSRFFSDAKDLQYLLALLLRQDTYADGPSVKERDIELSPNRQSALLETNRRLGEKRLQAAIDDGLPTAQIEKMRRQLDLLSPEEKPMAEEGEDSKSESRRITAEGADTIDDIQRVLLAELHDLNDDFRNFEGEAKPVSLMTPDELKTRRKEIATLMRRVEVLQEAYRSNQMMFNAEPELKVLRLFQFLTRELEMLWNQAQFYQMNQEEDLTVFPIGPQWIKILTDKDATLREPATPLTYKKARELIDLLRDGVPVRILTGSTPLESWRDIMVPIIRELTEGGRSELSDAEKQVILARLKILANDGTSIVTINTEDPKHLKPNPLRHARRWENGKWVPFATMKRVRYNKDTQKVEEDKSVRAELATISAREFLKRLLAGEGQDLDRLTQNFFSKIKNGKNLSQQKKEFVDFVDRALFVDPDDGILKDFIGHDDPEAMEKGIPQAWHDSHMSMLDLVEHMLNSGFSEGKVEDQDLAYYKRLNDLIKNHKAVVKAKIKGTDSIQYGRKAFVEVVSYEAPQTRTGDWHVKVKTKDGVIDDTIAASENPKLISGKAEYSDDEEIVATLLTLHYKESDWTFGSVSADKMTKVQKEGDSRTDKVATILVHDKKWWDGLAARIHARVTAAELVGMTDDAVDALLKAVDEGNYEEAEKIGGKIELESALWHLKRLGQLKDNDWKGVQDDPILLPILWGSRGGSGYYNAVGGSSKVEYLDGQTQTPDTFLMSPVMIGDSKTDQGRFPAKQIADFSYRHFQEIQKRGKKIPASLRNKIKVYEIRPEKKWYYDETSDELTDEEKLAVEAHIRIIAETVFKLRSGERLKNPSPQQQELREWLEQNSPAEGADEDEEGEDLISKIMREHPFSTEDVNWHIAKAFLKQGYEKRHKFRLEFIGRMTESDYHHLASLIPMGTPQDQDEAFVTAMHNQLEETMKGFFEYFKGPFSDRNVFRVLLAGIKEMDPEERERMERAGMQFQRYVKSGRRQMDDMTRLSTHYWEQMGPAFVYDFFRAFVNYTKEENRKGIYYLDANDPEEALNSVLLGIMKELRKIQPKAVGLFIPPSMRDLDKDYSEELPEVLVPFPEPKVVYPEEKAAASESRKAPKVAFYGADSPNYSGARLLATEGEYSVRFYGTKPLEGSEHAQAVATLAGEQKITFVEEEDEVNGVDPSLVQLIEDNDVIYLSVDIESGTSYVSYRDNVISKLAEKLGAALKAFRKKEKSDLGDGEEKSHKVFVLRSFGGLEFREIVQDALYDPEAVDRQSDENAYVDVVLQPDLSYTDKKRLKEDEIVVGLRPVDQDAELNGLDRGRHERTQDVLKRLYSQHRLGEIPLKITTPENASAILGAILEYLPSKLANFNDFATVAKLYGADLSVIAWIAGSDNRINPYYANVSAGAEQRIMTLLKWKRDAHLVTAAKKLGKRTDQIEAILNATFDEIESVMRAAVNGDAGQSMDLTEILERRIPGEMQLLFWVEMVLRINRRTQQNFQSVIEDELQKSFALGELKAQKVALWGINYELIRFLVAKGVKKIWIAEPNKKFRRDFREWRRRIELDSADPLSGAFRSKSLQIKGVEDEDSFSLIEVSQRADITIIAEKVRGIFAVSLEDLSNALANKPLFDQKNLLAGLRPSGKQVRSFQELREAGINYVSVGRNPVYSPSREPRVPSDRKRHTLTDSRLMTTPEAVETRILELTQELGSREDVSSISSLFDESDPDEKLRRARKQFKQRVSVTGGAGYVGIMTAINMAYLGKDVSAVDIAAKQVQVDELEAGHLPIYEEGLERLFKEAKEQGEIAFTTDTEKGLEGRPIGYVAVGTPQSENGQINASYLIQAAKQQAEAAKRFADSSGNVPFFIITVKSTATPDAYEAIVDALFKDYGLKVGVDYGLSTNAEFLQEGSAVRNITSPDRTALGIWDFQPWVKRQSFTRQDIEKAQRNRKVTELELLKLWYPLTLISPHPILISDGASVALGKYLANVSLAADIIKANIRARHLAKEGGDYGGVVRDSLLTHARTGRFVFAGAGFGGSCFKKDCSAIGATSTLKGGQPLLTATVTMALNGPFKRDGAHRLGAHVASYRGQPAPLKGRTIAVWGLEFKPGTDDTRDTPAADAIVELVEKMAAGDAYVRAYAPILQDIGPRDTTSDASELGSADLQRTIHVHRFKASFIQELYRVYSKRSDFQRAFNDFLESIDLNVSTAPEDQPQLINLLYEALRSNEAFKAAFDRKEEGKAFSNEVAVKAFILKTLLRIHENGNAKIIPLALIQNIFFTHIFFKKRFQDTGRFVFVDSLEESVLPDETKGWRRADDIYIGLEDSRLRDAPFERLQPPVGDITNIVDVRDLLTDIEGLDAFGYHVIGTGVRHHVAASEARGASTRELTRRFGSDGFRLIEEGPNFSAARAKAIRNLGKHASQGIYSVIALSERYQKELQLSEEQALDYAYTFVIRESLADQSRPKTPELTVAEAQALKVNGQDLGKRYFSPAQTGALNKKHVLVENLSGLPDLKAFATEIPWIRYLASHSNVVWSLDLDGVSEEDGRAFLKDLLEQIDAWGYSLESGQIIVRGSQVSGIDPENARMPRNKNQVHAYVAGDQDAFDAVPFRRDVEFRAVLSEEISEKVAERILAAEALQLGFNGDRYGIISGKELAEESDYQELVAGIQAFIHISAAA